MTVRYYTCYDAEHITELIFYESRTTKVIALGPIFLKNYEIVSPWIQCEDESHLSPELFGGIVMNNYIQISSEHEFTRMYFYKVLNALKSGRKVSFNWIWTTEVGKPKFLYEGGPIPEDIFNY
jgi:hypothetical protein